MSQFANRRGFLKRSAALAAGCFSLSGAHHFGAPRSYALGAEPIQRLPRSKFKFSLAAYSYRRLLTGEKPELTLLDFIEDCARFGLEGTELTSYFFPSEFDDAYLRTLQSACFRQGLDVSGTAIRNDFCFPPGKERTRELDHVKRWVEYADTLGAPVIRVFSGRPRSGQTQEEAHKLAVEGLEECCEHAGRHGVFLALENHGGLSTQVDDMLRLVRDVKSPWFGVNLDTGNFQGCSTADEAYEGMARMAPYALNVQVKVQIALANRRKAESDFSRLAAILKDSGYRGYIVLEYEESDDPRKASPRFIERLRAAFG